jgi:hypothetical protein
MRNLKQFALALIMVSMLIGACLAQTQSQSTKELAGWANTPSGPVWLRPNVDAYEHDTGLVRDTRTGQKYMPIRPSSVPQAPQVVVTPAPVYSPQPVVTPQPVYQPYLPPIVVSPPVYAPSGPSCPSCPNYRPNPYYSPGYRYDVGPYGNTVGQNYGFQPTNSNSQSLRSTYTRIK